MKKCKKKHKKIYKMRSDKGKCYVGFEKASGKNGLAGRQECRNISSNT